MGLQKPITRFLTKLRPNNRSEQGGTVRVDDENDDENAYRDLGIDPNSLTEWNVPKTSSQVVLSRPAQNARQRLWQSQQRNQLRKQWKKPGLETSSEPFLPITESLTPTETTAILEAKKRQHQGRRNLKQSGDWLGVQGADPWTGELVVLTPTESISSDKTTQSTKQLMADLGARRLGAWRRYEEARAAEEMELDKLKGRKEVAKLKKIENVKKNLRLQQGGGRWSQHKGRWSSVIEPNLSPIAQSLIGSVFSGREAHDQGNTLKKNYSVPGLSRNTRSAFLSPRRRRVQGIETSAQSLAKVIDQDDDRNSSAAIINHFKDIAIPDCHLHLTSPELTELAPEDRDQASNLGRNLDYPNRYPVVIGMEPAMNIQKPYRRTKRASVTSYPSKWRELTRSGSAMTQPPEEEEPKLGLKQYPTPTVGSPRVTTCMVNQCKDVQTRQDRFLKSPALLRRQRKVSFEQENRKPNFATRSTNHHEQAIESVKPSARIQRGRVTSQEGMKRGGQLAHGTTQTGGFASIPTTTITGSGVHTKQQHTKAVCPVPPKGLPTRKSGKSTLPPRERPLQRARQVGEPPFPRDVEQRNSLSAEPARTAPETATKLTSLASGKSETHQIRATQKDLLSIKRKPVPVRKSHGKKTRRVSQGDWQDPGANLGSASLDGPSDPTPVQLMKRDMPHCMRVPSVLQPRKDQETTTTHRRERSKDGLINVMSHTHSRLTLKTLRRNLVIDGLGLSHHPGRSGRTTSKNQAAPKGKPSHRKAKNQISMVAPTAAQMAMRCTSKPLTRKFYSAADAVADDDNLSKPAGVEIASQVADAVALKDSSATCQLPGAWPPVEANVWWEDGAPTMAASVIVVLLIWLFWWLGREWMWLVDDLYGSL